MRAKYAQDIVSREARSGSKAMVERFAFSLIFGTAVLAFLLAIGPKHMVENSINYAQGMFVLKVRELPLLGVRHQDIHEVAKAWTIMVRQGSQWTLFLSISAAATAIFYGLLTYRGWHQSETQDVDHVTRGATLITPKRHNQLIRRDYGKKPPNEMGRPLIMGGEKIMIPESLQYLHFAFLGAAGTGKSTAIQEIISQAIARGDKGLVVDVGGLFYSQFGRPFDHVLSLRDPRSEAWDFWHEEGISEEGMAAAMIEAEASNSYFWKGARAVLTSLLRHNRSTTELWDDFKKSTSQLREKLLEKDEISRRIIGEGDGDQADGIIGTTVLDFAFLKELNQWAKDDQKPFSIAHWINNNSDHSWTYILVTESDLEITKPLLRLWFDIACQATLQRDPGNKENCHTWLIMDEVKTLGKLPSLPSILDKGRKFKASVVLGLQAISQLHKIYGHDDAKSILQGVQNQFLFGVSEPESAKYVSELLGEQDVEQASFGLSFSSEASKDRGSINRTLVRKRLVMADEATKLKVLTAFVRLPRHQPLKICFKPKNRARVQELAKSIRKPQYEVAKGRAETRSETLVISPKAEASLPMFGE